MSSEFLGELKEINEWILRVQKQMSAFGHKIKEEFDLPQLKDQLLALPEQIKKTQIVALQKKAELSEVEQDMKECEAGISFEINSEMGGNGKAKFSNENARKSELTRRLVQNDAHHALKGKRSSIEFKLWEFEAEVDRLRNEFKSRIAIKDLVVAELNLYTK